MTKHSKICLKNFKKAIVSLTYSNKELYWCFLFGVSLDSGCLLFGLGSLSCCGWFWLAVGAFGWFWLVLGGFGWFWVFLAGCVFYNQRTHHDITDSVNHGMVKNIKTYEIRKFLICASDDTFWEIIVL